jgi:phosphatidylinositol alpha-1,6-mannosyltransferase
VSREGRAPLGLAVISRANTGDGLAYAARLFQAACEAREGGVRVMELGSAKAERVPLAVRARYTAEVFGRQLSGEVSGVLFSHVGIARAQGLLPGVLRGAYGVVLNGIEAWDPALGPDRRRVLREATVRIAISRHTAERASAAHPEIGPVEACPLALLPEATVALDGADARVVERIATRSILIVGRMSAAERYKGHDQLLESWPTVLERVPDAQLVVVGRGDDAERLRGKARDLGLAANVYFTGFISDETLRAVRKRVSAFAMPSTGEGFGLVYLEAMRDGLACIGSLEDAAKDIIVPGETGFLVPPADPGALAAAVAELLANETLRREYGTAGERRFRAEYTLDRFRARFLPLLAPLLGGRAGARAQ